MNLTDNNYAKYKLVQEMMDTIDVVKGFDPDKTKNIAQKIKAVGKLLMTGEGSSRIFPAKNGRVGLLLDWPSPPRAGRAAASTN